MSPTCSPSASASSPADSDGPAGPSDCGSAARADVPCLPEKGIAARALAVPVSDDAAIAAAMDAEPEGQRDRIEPVAPQGIASRDVLRARGSVPSDKSAQGCPGTRSRGGCEHVGAIGAQAIARARRPFGAARASGRHRSLETRPESILVPACKEVSRSASAPPGRTRRRRWAVLDCRRSRPPGSPPPTSAMRSWSPDFSSGFSPIGRSPPSPPTAPRAGAPPVRGETGRLPVSGRTSPRKCHDAIAARGAASISPSQERRLRHCAGAIRRAFRPGRQVPPAKEPEAAASDPFRATLAARHGRARPLSPTGKQLRASAPSCLRNRGIRSSGASASTIVPPGWIPPVQTHSQSAPCGR